MTKFRSATVAALVTAAAVLAASAELASGLDSKARMAFSPTVAALVRNSLDPGHRVPIPCGDDYPG